MLEAAQLDSIKHMKCFERILNQAAQQVLRPPSVSQLFGRIRQITAANHALEEKWRLLQPPPHKLKTDVSTKWNSALHMVDRFLQQQPSICTALLSPQVRKSAVDICTLTKMDISKADGSESSQASGLHHVRGEYTYVVNDCSTILWQKQTVVTQQFGKLNRRYI